MSENYSEARRSVSSVWRPARPTRFPSVVVVLLIVLPLCAITFEMHFQSPKAKFWHVDSSTGDGAFCRGKTLRVSIPSPSNSWEEKKKKTKNAIGNHTQAIPTAARLSGKQERKEKKRLGGMRPSRPGCTRCRPSLGQTGKKIKTTPWGNEPIAPRLHPDGPC